MIELRAVEKIYRRGAEEVHALRGVDLTLKPGEFVSIIGPSGSGKTTLLQILGCLDVPSMGTMLFDGAEVSKMTEADRVGLRRSRIGFIFQQFYLIPGLSVLDNIVLPAVFARREIGREKAFSLLELVGLRARADHRPNQLSGGEMQRAAIARALINDPEIILADEPTGNLDTENSEKIFGLLSSLNKQGFTVVMVTHNNDLASRADRVVHIRDGLVLN